MSDHGVLDFHLIIDGIYVGTNQCCQTHFEERLGALGISADISLEAEHIDMPFGVEAFLWLPTLDGEAPTQEALWLGVDVLERMVTMKQKVYVHCKNGHGRAPTLVAAYLLKQGESIEEAVSFLKQHRPSVHLSEAQQRALEVFARSL